MTSIQTQKQNFGRTQNSGQMESLWFSTSHLNDRAAVRLFCFPYAGGGSMIYRAWLRDLPPSIDAIPARLPGREARLNEVPLKRIEPLADALCEAMRPLLDRPFALFGHSMGAKLAFEVARRLSAAGFEPLHLFVSGARGPQAPGTDASVYNLPEPEFIEKLRELNGTPNEVLEHPELIRLLIPLLRADFESVHTYRYQAGLMLGCPITAYGGLKDRDVSSEHLSAWRKETAASFVQRMLPGDHFFINTERQLLIQSVSQELQRQLRRVA
jgi:medium-chain acyl-[acyl-carrier-protein] hydrolase